MPTSDTLAKVRTLLLEFKDWCNTFPGAIPDSVSFTSGVTKSPNMHVKHAVIIFLQHGDEWGTLPTVLDLLPWLRSTLTKTQTNVKITIILGNPKAAAICDRWIDSDLNRCYPSPDCFSPSISKTSPDQASTYESTRAKDIASIIASANMVLDLHQTSQPACGPFYVFPFHGASVALAQQMGIANNLLTRDIGNINEQERCIDDFAQALNIPIVVIEVGQKGDNLISRKHTKNAITSFVGLAIGKRKRKRKETTKKLRVLYISHRYKFTNRASKVSDGLINFSPVKSGSPLLLGTEVIYAPRDGFVVFMQNPARDAKGLIIGAIPPTAICFAETYFIESPVKTPTTT